MAKLSLTDFSSGYTLVATLNANNALIEAALENTLSRDGTTPNTMSADLDMNSNNINNVTDPTNAQQAATKAYVDSQISAVQSAGDFSAGISYTFTAAQTFDGAVTMDGGLTIRDSGETDSVAISHDGTDLNFTHTNTFDVNFGALTAGGKYVFANGIEVNTNQPVTCYNAALDEYIYMNHDGVAGVLNTANVLLYLKSGSSTEPMLFGATGYHFLEGSTAAADQTGFGQIWVKDDSVQKLKFTDDAGEDFDVPRRLTARKSADTDRASTTTLSNDPDLTLSLVSGGLYKVSALLRFHNDTTGTQGMDWNINFDGGTSEQHGLIHGWINGATYAPARAAITNAETTVVTSHGDISTVTATDVIYFEGILEAGGSGTLGVAWAQNASSANPATLEQGSYLIAERLD